MIDSNILLTKAGSFVNINIMNSCLFISSFHLAFLGYLWVFFCADMMDVHAFGSVPFALMNTGQTLFIPFYTFV